MEAKEILKLLAQGVVDGDEDAVLVHTEKAIEMKIAPLEIINNGLTKGIDIVGEYFSTGYYFLPDLILGAKAMEAGISMLAPLLGKAKQHFVGRVLMGTVEGDLHEIGKNIVIMMLKAAGFEVFDLGVDIKSSLFVDKIQELKPDIVGISALLTTTVERQREIIDILMEKGIRGQVKIMIGGAPINQAWADQIGADGYAEDANTAVEVARKFMGVVSHR